MLATDGVELTRKEYLNFAYLGDPPAEIDGELEAVRTVHHPSSIASFLNGSTERRACFIFINRSVLCHLRGPLSSALICSLCFSICPTAVPRRIGAVIVDAFNRVGSRGHGAHIGDEVTQRVQPSIAHGDSPSTPLVELFGVRVVTPLNHC